MATFVKARRAPARGDGRTDLRRLCWWSRPLPLATSLGSVFGHDSPSAARIALRSTWSHPQARSRLC